MVRFLHYFTIFYIIFLTLLLWLPDPRELLYGYTPPDDVAGFAHLITFTLLGLLVELDRKWGNFQICGSVLIFYAILTEVVQHFLPIRSFELNDIFQDFSGILVGILCGSIVKYCLKFFIKR
ncbi:MAG: VanZ family protein [Planctomycetaceae bacterium]|jgi:VanZ family protein|nr:VanZ family protein [Planctomycetaceae bacterium]